MRARPRSSALARRCMLARSSRMVSMISAENLQSWTAFHHAACNLQHAAYMQPSRDASCLFERTRFACGCGRAHARVVQSTCTQPAASARDRIGARVHTRKPSAGRPWGRLHQAVGSAIANRRWGSAVWSRASVHGLSRRNPTALAERQRRQRRGPNARIVAAAQFVASHPSFPWSVLLHVPCARPRGV